MAPGRNASTPSGRLDADKEWWSLAELDQAAATLALLDHAYARDLLST